MRRNTCFLNFSCSHIQWILLLMLMLVVIASMKIDLMSRLSSVDRDSRVEEISSGSSHMYSSLDLRLHRHWDSHWELLSFTFIWGWTCSYFSPGLDPASRRSEDLVLISFHVLLLSILLVLSLPLLTTHSLRITAWSRCGNTWSGQFSSSSPYHYFVDHWGKSSTNSSDSHKVIR